MLKQKPDPIITSVSMDQKKIVINQFQEGVVSPDFFNENFQVLLRITVARNLYTRYGYNHIIQFFILKTRLTFESMLNVFITNLIRDKLTRFTGESRCTELQSLSQHFPMKCCMDRHQVFHMCMCAHVCEYMDVFATTNANFSCSS